MSKLIIIISVISLFVLVFIIGIILYFRNRNKNNNSNTDTSKCKGQVCGNNCCENGLKCQNDQQTCCKDELWAKNEKNFNVCCDSPLCGNICCDKDHTCGVDKNNNPVCCSGKVEGDNKLCCSATGEEYQENGTCCKPELWDKTNKKCCTKPLCNGICCDDTEQCDNNQCVKCNRELCDGKCCPINDICRKNSKTNKKVCCDQELCGDNCCGIGETCLSDLSCCKNPCGKAPDDKCCNDPNAPYCITANNSSICCQSNIPCIDITTKEPRCYDSISCGQNSTTKKYECCSGKNQKYIDGKCIDICGNDHCIPGSQECVIYDGVAKGCKNIKCEWSPFNYDPSIQNKYGFIEITNTNDETIDKQILACSYTDNKNIKRNYIVNNPKDPDNPTQTIPISKLKRTATTTEDPLSPDKCNLNNCYDRVQEYGMNYVTYDDSKIPHTCSSTYDCSKLQSLDELNAKGNCPILTGNSCCKDKSGNFTGQVCSGNRSCYLSNCICNDDEEPDNCVVFDRKRTCNNNGYPNLLSEDYSCDCDYNYAGKNCEYSRVKTCSGNGDPNNDGSCTCDINYTGVNCQIPTYWPENSYKILQDDVRTIVNNKILQSSGIIPTSQQYSCIISKIKENYTYTQYMDYRMSDYSKLYIDFPKSNEEVLLVTNIARYTSICMNLNYGSEYIEAMLSEKLKPCKIKEIENKYLAYESWVYFVYWACMFSIWNNDSKPFPSVLVDFTNFIRSSCA